MAQYMDLTTSMALIPWKLSVIFGTKASFDVLMQNFNKLTQGNNDKVPSFAMRLEGILNQILGWQLATMVNTKLVDTQTPVQNITTTTNKVSDVTTTSIHTTPKVLTGLYNLRSCK